MLNNVKQDTQNTVILTHVELRVLQQTNKRGGPDHSRQQGDGRAAPLGASAHQFSMAYILYNGLFGEV